VVEVSVVTVSAMYAPVALLSSAKLIDGHEPVIGKPGATNPDSVIAEPGSGVGAGDGLGVGVGVGVGVGLGAGALATAVADGVDEGAVGALLVPPPHAATSDADMMAATTILIRPGFVTFMGVVMSSQGALLVSQLSNAYASDRDRPMQHED
jgi:hypothetical protein